MLHRFYTYLLKNQVILALVIIVLGWFLYQIRGILMSVFVSYILMAALLPAAQFLEKRGLPKILSVAIPFFFASILIFLIILPVRTCYIGKFDRLYKSSIGNMRTAAEISEISLRVKSNFTILQRL